jgi:hypothetical protein
LSTGLWVPGSAEPSLERLVAGIHGQIERYTTTHTAERSHVQVELGDGEWLTLRSLSAEPGFGFLTLSVHSSEGEPGELIVPVTAIRRIELGPADDPQRPGFALPQGEATAEPEAPAAGP